MTNNDVLVARVAELIRDTLSHGDIKTSCSELSEAAVRIVHSAMRDRFAKIAEETALPVEPTDKFVSKIAEDAWRGACRSIAQQIRKS